MVKHVLRILAACYVAQGLLLSQASAAPAGYDHILTKHETILIDGNTVAVPIEIWLKSRFVDGAAFFDIWADANLSGVQDKAPDIAGRMSRHRQCGDRIRVNNVSLVPKDQMAKLCIRVRYEKWQCLKAALPALRGFKLTFVSTTAAKTRIVAQNAHVCADMWPVIAEDGQAVKLEGKVTKNSVSGSAGLFGDLFNARGKFRSRLRQEVNRAMLGLKLPVPEALRSFDPVVDEARFRAREDGSLGMVFTMQVEVTSSELPRILAALSQK